MPSSHPVTAPAQVDTLVSGGIVVTMDPLRRVIADGAVAIQAGRIVAVGERESVEASCRAQQRIDASGRTAR